MNLLEALEQRALVVDGAMGTQLQALGLGAGEPGDAWSLEHPERVRAVHEAYRDAGCDILTTNSFGANAWVMERYGYRDLVVELNRAAAALAAGVAAAGQVVLGDVGPSGLLIEPLGEATIPQLRVEFERQARALLEGGADGIIVETMSDLQEALVAVEASRSAGAPVVVACLTLSRLPNGRLRTIMGVAPEEGAVALAEAGAAVVGANCGIRMGFADFAAAVQQMRGAAGVPTIAMPNAGQPSMVGERAVYALEPMAFAEGMRTVLEAGARIVGGCCGTTPAHIAALRCVVSG